MLLRIAVISDIHYADRCQSPKRKGEWALHLLTEAVRRLNEDVRPDVVAVLGDLIDDPAAPDRLERLEQLRDIIERVDAPYIVLPGNHDPEPNVFYRVMPRPADAVDIKGVRFISFVDAEEPGWNASRSATDLARMDAARADGHTGPLVMLQHVPVLPPGATSCPYTYTNIDDVISRCDAQALTLSIGGHHHRGTQPVKRNKTTYLCVKALCEEPFVFTTVDLAETEARVAEHTVPGP